MRRVSRPIIVQEAGTARAIMLAVIESEVTKSIDALTALGGNGYGRIYHARKTALLTGMCRKNKAKITAATQARERWTKAKKALEDAGLVIYEHNGAVELSGAHQRLVQNGTLEEMKAKRAALREVLDEARLVAVGPDSEMAEAMARLRAKVRAIIDPDE